MRYVKLPRRPTSALGFLAETTNRLQLTDEALTSWRPPKATPQPQGQGISAERTKSMIGTQPRATLFASRVDRHVEECKGVSTYLLHGSPAALGLDICCLFGADEERHC